MHWSENETESVILLHGFAARPMIMHRLGKRLKKHGYRVENWGYRSVGSSVPRLTSRCCQRLERFLESPSQSKIHIVAHSLGGIIGRCVMDRLNHQRLHRLVMLAPPNRGTPVARRSARLLGRLYPVLHDLSDHSESYVSRLSENPKIEIGIIAARGDRVVRLPDTYLEHQTDHIVVPGIHTDLPLRRPAIEQTLAFLRNGTFARESESVDADAGA